MAGRKPAAATPSGEGRGQTRRAKVRKEDIVRRAEVLFGERGYAQTRMSDIAEAAGVTKGLLYWYFASKEELIAEILLDVREQLRDVQRVAIEGIDDPLAQVYVGTVASVRFVLEHYRLFQVNVEPTSALREITSESAVVHAADTAQTLAEGQRRGTIRGDDEADVLAYGNAGIVNQFCISHHAGRIRGSIDDVAHAATRFIVRGLATDLRMVAAVEKEYGPKRERAAAKAKRLTK